MAKRWRTVFGLIAILLVGFAAGAYVGVLRLWAVIEPAQRSEVAAAVNFGIDELLWLRTDNPDRALGLMEQRLDWAILGLSQKCSWKELSPEARRSLLTAKRYRERYPFAKAMPEARAALAAVPNEPLDPASLNSATRILLAAPASR